ncbi:MAG: twin-arginine translocase subunit TatB [Acetobacteraceae bacterium]|nr:MAG: twin-arginine translocase subunit TatB [Acetobacteraceae bacterium]
MDFSWSEMMLVGIVALIVIGPKDLPGMFRELGRITAKIRSMGREFSRAMEQAAKESGVKEATDGLKTLTNPVGTGLNAVKSAADKFEKWDPIKNAAVPTKPLTPPPMPSTPTPAAATVTTLAEAAPVDEVGPATAELYKKKAARKAVVDEAAAKLKAISQPEPTAPAAAPKAPGRRRKKAEPAAASGGDGA